MSKKTETKQRNVYNQGSMNVFDQLQPGIQASLLQDMALDPRQNKTFNMKLAEMMRQNNLLLQNNIEQSMLNNQVRGIPMSSGISGMQLGKFMRQASGANSNAIVQNWLAHEEARRRATGMAMGYQPLQIGQDTTQKTSGLGTWLPQVLGAGIMGGAALLTGGANLAGAGAKGGGIMAAGRALGSGANYFMNPSAANGFAFNQLRPEYSFGGVNTGSFSRMPTFNTNNPFVKNFQPAQALAYSFPLWAK